MATAIIVLAAGQGTRMQSDTPKVLHKVAGAPLLAHAMRAGEDIAAARTVVVVGHGGADVQAAALELNEDVAVVEQSERLGTAHAVLQARPVLEDFHGDVIVLYGDTPFVSAETLDALTATRADGAAVVVLGFEAADPTGYGRLVISGDGQIDAIVEEAEADAATRALTLCNSGVVAADAGTLFSLLEAVDNDNSKGEYYLTDIIGLARSKGLRTAAVTCDEAETLGVNSRADLAAAEAVFQARARAAALEAGVTLVAPETVFFAFDTVIGRDVVIEPYVTFGPEVTIETGAHVRAFCHLEGCHISDGAVVGPFARLRPGTELGAGARVGNFVEIKAAEVGPGAKINHLSYIGDATIGEGANIGAGTITCNYDGVFKHHTTIGEGAFVGSNSALVAPVVLGDGAYVASGSVITSDVAPGDMAIARSRQVAKTGLGAKLVARLRKLKQAERG